MISEHRDVLDAAAADLPEAVRRISLGGAAGPVQHQPSSASIMPSVTMKLGTLSNVVIRPLIKPMNAPRTNISTSTGITLESSSPDQVARNDHLHGDDRTHRQVEFPGDDHEVLPDRGNRNGGGAADEADEGLGLAERRVLG